MISELLARRLVLVTGKGGVGKSTVAAALALVAARRGKRVVVCEVDEPSAIAPLLGAKAPGHAPSAAAHGVHLALLSPDAGLSALDFILIAIPLVVAAPIVEELVFRGVLYRYLRGGLGVLLAVLLSALVFAVLHVVIPPLFLMGIVLAALAQRTNSLLPGIVLHATNNGLIVLAIWAASRSA